MSFFDKFMGSVQDIKVEITSSDIKIHGYLFSNDVIRRHVCKLDRFKFLYKKRTMIYFETFRFFLPEVKLLLEYLVTLRNKYGVHIPNCKLVLELIEKFEKEYGDKLNNEIDRSIIEKTMTFKVQKHQEDTIDNYLIYKNRLGLRGLLLDADPGTGKTFMSLALVTGIKADKVLIICPLPTVENVWVKSLTAPGDRCFNDIQPHFNIRDKFNTYKNEKFIICHYEGLEKLDEFLKLNNYFKKEKVAIIVDESHNFNENKSKRSNLLVNTINSTDTDNVFLLSGTPIKGTFQELIMVFSLLSKDFESNILKRFVGFYRSAGDPIASWLKDRYKNNSVKVQKSSLGLDPVITSYVKIKLPQDVANKFLLTSIRDDVVNYVKKRLDGIKEKRKEYTDRYNAYLEEGFKILLEKKEITEKDIKKYKEYAYFIHKNMDILAFHTEKLKYCNDVEAMIIKVLNSREDKEEFKELKVIYKYAHLKAQGEALGRIVTRARINCHVELARAIRYEPLINSTDKKSLIFSNYVEVCESSYKALKSLKYKPLQVYGDYVKQLATTVDKFRTGKENPLVATYQSLGTGVPLITANVVICLDLPFRQYLYDQAISRVWRLGQDRQVYVYIVNLDTGEEPNINTRNIDIIKYFKEEVERLIGYKSAIDLAESEVLSAEARTLLRDSTSKDLVIDRSKYSFSSNTFKTFNRWTQTIYRN